MGFLFFYPIGTVKLELEQILNRIAYMPVILWIVVGIFALLLVLAIVRKLFKVGCLLTIIIIAIFALAQLF